VAILRVWMEELGGSPDSPLFPSRRRTPLSRDAIERLIYKYALAGAERCPSLRDKSISPHALRHSCAMSLQMSNVAVFASFHTVRDEVPPGDMDLSSNVAVRSSRDEALVGAGIHQR
jgi:integrase